VQRVIQIASRATQAHGQDYPKEVHGIKMARKCQLLHFLHGSESSRDQFVGSYLIHFANGQKWEIPVLGEDLGDYPFQAREPNPPNEAKRSVIAWTVKDKPGQVPLYQTSWQNPLPDLEVESIGLVSAMDWKALFLVAITVE
jgi:hypothetical protein